MLTTGLYAGTYGPVTLGPLQLPVFEFEFIDRLRADALPFARTKLQLAGEPVVGWHGVSTKSFHVTVKNTGDRSIGYIVVRLRGAGGRAGFEEKLNGPFPPGRSKDLYPRLRPGIHAAYSSGKTDASYFVITKAKF